MLGGSRAARPKPIPVQGSKAREKRSMIMRHLYWQEKRRASQMRHSPVVGAGLWGFCASSTHFPHHCPGFSVRLPADHAGFCTWFYAGFCNDFGGVLGLTTARRPFGGLFLRENRFMPPICRPKRTAYFRLLPNGKPRFLPENKEKQPFSFENDCF